jgi:hypothetical protein
MESGSSGVGSIFSVNMAWGFLGFLLSFWWGVFSDMLLGGQTSAPER